VFRGSIEKKGHRPRKRWWYLHARENSAPSCTRGRHAKSRKLFSDGGRGSQKARNRPPAKKGGGGGETFKKWDGRKLSKVGSGFGQTTEKTKKKERITRGKKSVVWIKSRSPRSGPVTAPGNGNLTWASRERGRLSKKKKGGLRKRENMRKLVPRQPDGSSRGNQKVRFRILWGKKTRRGGLTICDCSGHTLNINICNESVVIFGGGK